MTTSIVQFLPLLCQLCPRLFHLFFELTAEQDLRLGSPVNLMTGRGMGSVKPILIPQTQ